MRPVIAFISLMPSGVYVHIPFCKSRCLYCNFYSQTDMALEDALSGDFVKEIELLSARFPSFQAETIYIGGGTPSCLKIESIGKILDAVKRWFCRNSPALEISIEVNPDDVTGAMLNKYRELGINRLSIGIQSFADSELQLLGRRHNSKQNHAAMGFAQQAGFENISLDLIFAIPDQHPEWLAENLRRALEYKPKHISLYCLAFEQGTPLEQLLAAGRIQALREEEQAELFLAASRQLREVGYIQYEISNFALPGYECLHNRTYWKMGNYLGVGPAAHSHIEGLRWANYRNPVAYSRAIGRGVRPAEFEERLSAEKIAEEYLMLSLRLGEGLDLGHYSRLAGVDICRNKGQLIDLMLKQGLAIIKGNNLRLTLEGMVVADEITAKLV